MSNSSLFAFLGLLLASSSTLPAGDHGSTGSDKASTISAAADEKDGQAGPGRPPLRRSRDVDKSSTTTPILLASPSADQAKHPRSAKPSPDDTVPAARAAISTITVSFEGSGAGMEECSGTWGFQRITYDMEVDFEVVGVNPLQFEDIVFYDLSSKIGTIHFYGTAEDQYYGETTILDFDITQSLDLQNTEGTIEYPTAQPDDIYIGFAVPPSGSLPCSIYIQYSAAFDLVRNTVNMPYPWNAGIGCLDNNYDVPGTDDFRPGRVLFEDRRTPIIGAKVYAYEVTLGGMSPASTMARMLDPETTDDNGIFILPQAFKDPGNQNLGLLAEVTYTDAGTGQENTIRNYRNYDPLQTLSLQAADAEKIEIRFPYPVVLQAGWQDGTGGFTAFANYLRADPAQDDSKRTAKLPAFLTFSMPSSQADGKNWGYDNAAHLWGPLTRRDPHVFYGGNVQRLHSFIAGPTAGASLRPELAKLVPASQLDALPIHLVAHSMGGTISRGWLSMARNGSLSGAPAVKRYVSFDGVHGATTFFWGSIGAFSPIFAEWRMNGYNAINGQPPEGNAKGWNYSHTVSQRGSHLLLSSSDCKIVRPNCSALGVGRTMKGSWWPKSWMDNGHRGRFIGGWEMHLRGDETKHTRIREHQPTIKSVTRFLATGVPPEGSTLSGTAYDCVDDPSPGPVPMATESPEPGLNVVTLEAGAHATVDVLTHVDANSTVDVTAIVEGSGAGLDVLDPGGQSVVPATPEIVDFGDARSITFSLSAPVAGVYTLRLTADAEAATALVQFGFDNQRNLQLELPDAPLLPNASARIAAALRTGEGDIIPCSGGSIVATVTAPDTTQHGVALFDDGSHDDEAAGDGVYANTFGATGSGGRYFVHAQAQLAIGSEIAERAAIGEFVVDSSSASLVGVVAERVVDDTGDGKSDRLEFDLESLIDEPGDYELRAVLQDSQQVLIAERQTAFTIASAGTPHTATLAFDCKKIMAHGVPGPWTLTQIELFNATQGVTADTLDPWTTATYDLAGFALPDPPIVTHTVPDHGPVQGGNETILQGDHLDAISALTLGEVAISQFEVLSDSAVRFIVPPAPNLVLGQVSLQVVTPWATRVFPNLYTYQVTPDFDLDGDVDDDDRSVFVAAFGTSEGEPGYIAEADLDSDGTIGCLDWSVFQAAWTGPPVEVPRLPPCDGVVMTQSVPASGQSLWRNQKNITRLTFDWDLSTPPAGAVMIQEMIAGGTYGEDLSAGFTFTIENNGQGQPRVLKVRETGTTLQHRKWYAVRNTGAWTGVAPFTVQYVVQVGDANNDGRVLNTDFGVINAVIPIFSAADDDRRDINGDGRVLNTDFGVTNSKIPSFTVAKPEGH